MILTSQCIASWPKLAWVAKAQTGGQSVHILHGPLVEVRDEWIVEAVWDGPFDEGNFDRTELVFGTGVRLRPERVVFVASATGVECLWHSSNEGVHHVSNSLACLLAAAELSLKDDYPHYARDIYSVETAGIPGYTQTLPAAPSEVNLTYFKNIVFDGQGLSEVSKPETTPPLGTYTDYHSFLMSVAGKLKANIQSSERRTTVESFVGISSGYDSPAAAVVAREAGCSQACTITKSNSLWRGSDSGAEIAAALGMSCREHKVRASDYRREPTIWAVSGRSGGLNMTAFEYPKPLCIFFNGSYGDHVWDKRIHDFTKLAGDIDSFLGEFRLHEGMFHTVVPWWGISRAAEVNRLGSSDEMKPWSVGGSYDRPVARRLVEDAGVPRGTFGICKKNTSSNTYFRWPFGREAQRSLAAFRRKRGMSAPSRFMASVIRKLALWDALFYKNVTKRFGIKKGWRPWKHLADESMMFRWANAELKASYERGLAESAGQTQGSSE